MLFRRWGCCKAFFSFVYLQDTFFLGGICSVQHAFVINLYIWKYNVSIKYFDVLLGDLCCYN